MMSLKMNLCTRTVQVLEQARLWVRVLALGALWSEDSLVVPQRVQLVSGAEQLEAIAKQLSVSD